MLLSVLELGVDETEPFAGKQGHRATGSTFIGTVLVAQPRCARSARNRLMHSEEDKDAVLDCNDVLYWNCDRVGLDRHPARSLTPAQELPANLASREHHCLTLTRAPALVDRQVSPRAVSNSRRSLVLSRRELSVPREDGAGGLVGAEVFDTFD
jgi:hypothetical protein